jgi:xylulokinase
MTASSFSGPWVIGIDLGTTTVKAGLFSAEGRCVAMASSEQELRFPAPGRVEQAPEATWQLQCETVREAVSRAGVPPDGVVAAALSIQRGTAIVLGLDGTPLTNHIVWMDRRGAGQLEWVRALVGAERYYDACGHPLVPYTGLSKVLWARREAREVAGRYRVIAPPQTYHLRRMGVDDFVCDPSVGTFFFPFDLHRARWNAAMLSALDVPESLLPRVVASTTALGRLSRAAAEACGLSPRTQIVAGGGDGQCAAVGSDVVRSGRVMINIGTATGVQTYLDAPRLDPRRHLNCAMHVVPGAWEMEGHTQASGAVLRWVRDHLWLGARDGAASAYDRMVEEASQAPRGAGGLLVLPTFNGTSAPSDRPEFRGAILGLTLRHDRASVLRAFLEGISLEIRWMLDAMREAGVAVGDVRLVGGGSASPGWNRIHADILGVPVRTVDVPDAAVTGAAICAAVGAGLYRDVHAACAAFVRPGATWNPEPASTDIYEPLYAVFRRTIEALGQAGTFARLGELDDRGGAA